MKRSWLTEDEKRARMIGRINGPLLIAMFLFIFLASLVKGGWYIPLGFAFSGLGVAFTVWAMKQPTKWWKDRMRRH